LQAYLRPQNVDKADGDVAKNSEIKCLSYAEVCIMKKINHVINSSATYANRNKLYKNVET